MTRPLYLRRASEAHSPKRRRFDFSGSRAIYLGFAWGVLNGTLLANGWLSFQHGEVLLGHGLCLTGYASSVGEIAWLITSVAPSLSRSRRSADAVARAQWRAMARRRAFLMAEIAKRKKKHQATAGFVAELRELTTKVLAGRAS